MNPDRSNPSSNPRSNPDLANLAWQSKLVLLLVLPYTATSAVFQSHEWTSTDPNVVIWTLGLSVLLGLVAWKTHSATAAAAATGAIIAASVIFSTLVYPYHPWQTGLIPLVAVLLLTSLATRFGSRRKERLGTAEKRMGRGAAQVAANLGMAALLFEPSVRSMIIDTHWLSRSGMASAAILVLGLAALAEAAADTVSSEIGQVLGGQPRMITDLRKVDAGTDGAISLAGTLAGALAAGLVASAGMWALHGDRSMLIASWAGGVFGLVFDSLLGATFERRGWLNNDAVNFLSTIGAAACALGLLAVMSHPGIG